MNLVKLDPFSFFPKIQASSCSISGFVEAHLLLERYDPIHLPLAINSLDTNHKVNVSDLKSKDQQSKTRVFTASPH